MKHIILPLFLLLSLFCYAQPDFSWRQEMKVKSGIIDYNILSTDDGSNYFIQRRLNTLGQPNSVGESLTYINVSKSDQAFKELWSKEYFLALAKYDVFAVKAYKNELMLFLSEYDEKTKHFTIDLVPLPENGSMPKQKMFSRIAAFPRNERKENFFKVKLADVNNGSILISDLSGKKSISYAFTRVSPDFKTTSSTIIKREGDPDLFDVEDVKIQQDHILVLGKEYEIRLNVEGKKRKKFKRYVLSAYNMEGDYKGDVPLDRSRIISSARLAEVANRVVFAGTYNDFTLRGLPDGILSASIDVVNRTFINENDFKIESSLFQENYLGEKDTSELFKKLPPLSLKNQRRFSGTETEIAIRTIDVQPNNNSFIVAAELVQIDEYDEHIYGNTSFGLAGIALKSGEIIKVFEIKTKDLVLIHADSSAKVDWIKVIPKNQQETFMYALPQKINYSSFKSSYADNHYSVIYNDNKANVSSGLQKQVHVVWDFKKEASLFSLRVDPINGDIQRSMLGNSSDEEAILMPLKATSAGTSFIAPARGVKFIGKDIFKMAVVNTGK